MISLVFIYYVQKGGFMAIKFNAKSVNLNQLQKDAEQLYGADFYCSEAIVCSIHEHFQLDCPVEIICMTSAMPVGVGGSGCMCGALNGGLAMLGCFFGRSEKGSAEVNKCMQLGKELHDWFKIASEKNSTCCRVLTKGMNFETGDHVEQCVKFTGMVARKVGEIVVREFNL